MRARLQQFHVLLYREFRDRRGFLLALALCAPALSILGQLTWLDLGDGKIVARWILPGLLAMVLGALGADLGAREMENGTDVTLARLPAGRGILLAAKLGALVFGGALLGGWILTAEILCRTALGWPVEELLLELQARPLPLLLVPIVALGSWTMAVLLGRTFVALLAAVSLIGGAPLALRQLATHVAWIDDALFTLASIPIDTWLVTIGVAFAVAAAFAYRPGKREEARAFLGACLGATLLIGPAAAAAYVASWSTALVTAVQVDPSPEGRTVAIQLHHTIDTWWDTREQTTLWWTELEDDVPSPPVRIPDGQLVLEENWNEDGELELYDPEAQVRWALEPRSGVQRVMEVPFRNWCERSLGPDRSVLYTWDGNERVQLRGEPTLQPVPSEPGLLVWGDRETNTVWRQRMDGADAEKVCSVERLGLVRISPHVPVLQVIDTENESFLYVHALTGQILCDPIGYEHSHVSWVDHDDVYAALWSGEGTGSTFRFLGADPPAPFTIEGKGYHYLRFVGEDRVVTWPLHAPGPVVLRDLEGRAITTLWE